MMETEVSVLGYDVGERVGEEKRPKIFLMDETFKKREEEVEIKHRSKVCSLKSKANKSGNYY